MRDIVKNEEYFLKCISYEKDRIIKFSQALKSIETDNIKGRYNALIYLANFNKNLFKLSYSIGESIEGIYSYYEEWIKYYSEVCTEYDGIYDVIDILSIATFYKNRKTEFERYLITIIHKINLNDGMLNLCLKHLDLDYKEATKSKLPYLNKLLESDNKVEILKSIPKEWYEFHKDAYWYNSHKSKNDTYCGYWSFDLGAVVKILKLDDKVLKQEKYYPYDLVHFND